MTRSAARRERRDQIAGRDVSTKDGRSIDPKAGTLLGEAGHMKVRSPEKAFPIHVAPQEHQRDTYYGLPLLKEPVWKASIPTYFFTGGAAGGAFVLGAAAQLSGARGMRTLAERARLLGFASLGVSAVLLIADLGRPARFYQMLRVFRPTSPMNLGTWVISGAGLGGLVSVLFPRTRLGDAAGLAAGAFGLPLSSYTAVLIANTAVPVWARARATLPVLFAASAMASAGACLELSDLPRPAARAAKLFGLAGKLGEVLAGAAVERELGKGSRVAAPLREGASGALWKAARALTAASLVTSLVLGKSKRGRAASSLLAIAGALSLRFAVTKAGKQSARDPRAVTEPERAQAEERGAALAPVFDAP